MSNINKQNFNAKLTSLVKSSKTIRDNAQALLVFGLEQYRDHGDTGYLSRLVLACNDVKTLPARTIKDYIKAHANVVWSKGKDGVLRFAKASKGVDAVVQMPDVEWYNWDGNGNNQANADLNIASRFKGLVTSLKKAKEEGKSIKTEGMEDHLKELGQSLGFKVQFDA